MPRALLLVAMATAVTLSGCATTVLQQRIPIATDPAGATASTDGGLGCITPCALDLDRNRDHIVTLELAGHAREDVIVRRQYRTADVMLSAINAGLSSARTFNNASWALQSGLANKSAQESSGAAYTLEPTVIQLRLRPSGTPTIVAQTGPGRAGTVPGGSLMAQLDRDDEHLLEQALENTASGAAMAWTNARSGQRITVVPDNVALHDGQVVRPFVLTLEDAGQVRAGRLQGVRVGRGEWQVVPTPLGATPAAAVPLGEFRQPVGNTGVELGTGAR